MTIHLSEDMEQIVKDAVRAGLYAREDDVVRDALTRLKEAMPKAAASPDRRTKRTKPVQPRKKPLTRDELNQQLMAAGLITSLPDPALDIDDDDPDDQPVTIKGEPLSETIIRERRRRWRESTSSIRAPWSSAMSARTERAGSHPDAP